MVNRTNWHNDHPVACTCANCQEKARIRNTSDRKIGRNEKCPCGSEKKYKKCHGGLDDWSGTMTFKSTLFL